MAAVKYIFITGGVTSSLGKGIIAASLGKLLQARGYRVTIQKLDPYINVDAGTMNPYEHGECYVTEDGAETDLDLGHYERFLDITTSQANNVTTGKIYHTVITKERKGAYLGKTVQVVPHITDEIKHTIFALGEAGQYDFVIIEIGGSVGDIESLPFIEAIRQIRWHLAPADFLSIHLTLIPYLRAVQELKTKPTQHAVKQLQAAGIQPNVLICRTEKPLPPSIREKLSLFCNITPDAVIEAMDISTIYEVPLLMRQEKLDEQVLTQLHLPLTPAPDLASWKVFLNKLMHPQKTLRIGLIGKYTAIPDAYKSIQEALTHAGAYHDCQIDLQLISFEVLQEDNIVQSLAPLQAILIAPGFGTRGIEEKIRAIQYARETQLPLFGICLGMQCAVIEFARNVLGWQEAASTEQSPQTPYPVITLTDTQQDVVQKGGSMRLGEQSCQLTPGSKAAEIYGTTRISERHRHRYEFNNKYLKDFGNAGMVVTGTHPETGLVEIVELAEHPWFIGTQFHPEFKSTPLRPHPLFVSFLQAVKTLVH
ncbi:MAG: CTP synthase [Amoebophilaceae bacterium]|jgi:CTP synthase|nr:CTP synthase [Amoebophilaceae bacterium]